MKILSLKHGMRFMQMALVYVFNKEVRQPVFFFIDQDSLYLHRLNVHILTALNPCYISSLSPVYSGIWQEINQVFHQIVPIMITFTLKR